MSTVDPWIHVLQAIEPRYLELADLMKTGPKIHPILKGSRHKGSRRWTLSIEEDWQSVDDAGNYFNSSNHDKIIDWADEELKKWKCRRTAWNIWEFSSKREADKFILLFHMTWQM